MNYTDAGDLMIRFYAIQPYFYQTVQIHKALLNQLSKLSNEQRDCILIRIEKAEIAKSALTYFRSAIYEKEDELLFDMQVAQGKCKVIDGIVELDNEKNPFYELLCRKYPFYISQEC